MSNSEDVQIIEQPGGKYAVWDMQKSCFLIEKGSAEDVVNCIASNARKAIIEHVNGVIDKLTRGQKPYGSVTMSYNDALRFLGRPAAPTAEPGSVAATAPPAKKIGNAAVDTGIPDAQTEAAELTAAEALAKAGEEQREADKKDDVPPAKTQDEIEADAKKAQDEADANKKADEEPTDQTSSPGGETNVSEDEPPDDPEKAKETEKAEKPKDKKPVAKKKATASKK